VDLVSRDDRKEVDEVEFKNDELAVVVAVVVFGCDDAEVLYEKSKRRENSRARPMSSSENKKRKVSE